MKTSGNGALVAKGRKMKKHEIWFLSTCLNCGSGGAVHSVQNGATAYSPSGRTFTYSDVLEYAAYDNLVRKCTHRSKLTVADKFALMIDAYFLLSELVDKGFLELLDNSKESGLLYRMTTAGATLVW